MTFYLDDESLAELRSALESPALRPYMQRIESDRVRGHAQQLRNDVTANWLDKVMDRLYQSADIPLEAGLVNDKTGAGHTVESMVEHYRERVGLDALTKEASAVLPLSLKQAGHGIVDLQLEKKNVELDKEEESSILNDMIQSISDHLSSHRGHADEPAILYDLRSVFGEDIVRRNVQRLKDEIKSHRKQYGQDDVSSRLPYAPKGQPIKIQYGPSEEDNLFRNIRDRGGSNAR